MIMKKQNSWFRTEVDFENSFKFWFALMWQNTYIQIFAVAFPIMIYELCRFGACIESVRENFVVGGTAGGIATILGLLIPPAVVTAIAYKGFWQYFNDLKNKRSR